MSNVVFSFPALVDRWGMEFGDAVDYWSLLVHLGLIEATEEEKQDVEMMCEWGEANGAN